MKKLVKVAIIFGSINGLIRLVSTIFEFENQTLPLRLAISIVGLSATLYYLWKERNMY